MLLDPEALEAARRAAGVLPTVLAKDAKWSVDRLAAIVDGADTDISLSQLRRLAETLGITPIDLLARPAERPENLRLAAQLVKAVFNEQLRPIDAHAARLSCTVDELRDAVDAWNADPGQALKLVVRNDHVGLVADPHLEIPAPPPAVRAKDASAALDADRVLWQVIDRQLPDPIDDELAGRLAGLDAAGLVTELDEEWRPTDHVIELFGRTDWDTAELIAFGRGRSSAGH